MICIGSSLVVYPVAGPAGADAGRRRAGGGGHRERDARTTTAPPSGWTATWSTSSRPCWPLCEGAVGRTAAPGREGATATRPMTRSILRRCRRRLVIDRWPKIAAGRSTAGPIRRALPSAVGAQRRLHPVHGGLDRAGRGRGPAAPRSAALAAWPTGPRSCLQRRRRASGSFSHLAEQALERDPGLQGGLAVASGVDVRARAQDQLLARQRGLAPAQQRREALVGRLHRALDLRRPLRGSSQPWSKRPSATWSPEPNPSRTTSAERGSRRARRRRRARSGGRAARG